MQIGRDDPHPQVETWGYSTWSLRDGALVRLQGLLAAEGSAMVVVLLFLVLTCGCGNPHGTVKVSGRVTIGGENPPGPGTVTFTVVRPSEGFPNRPAMGKFDTDGAYTVTSYDPGDGLLPGSYSVAIECYETPPNMDGKPVKSYIDNKYLDPATSGFELVVDPKSKPVVFDIDLE